MAWNQTQASTLTAGNQLPEPCQDPNVLLSYSVFHIHMWRQRRTQNFVQGGGSKTSVEDRGQRERGSGGSNPLVRGSGGSCNLVQEISFHIGKFS
jgi:hypothetical protein